MFDYAINNETARGADLPPFLIVNHIYEGDTAMTKRIHDRKTSKCQEDLGVFQLPLFERTNGDSPICIVCNKPFDPPARYSKTQKLCSNECSHIHQRFLSINFCEQCGKSFVVHRHVKNSQKYCSHECKGLARRGVKLAGNYRRGFKPEGGFETRFKSGSEHPLWKGGVSHKHSTIRRSREYVEWRKAVYQRDHYECQECNKNCRQLDIVAHHIKSFAEHKHLRFKVDNGITLCRSCHIRLHKTNGDLS